MRVPDLTKWQGRPVIRFSKTISFHWNKQLGRYIPVAEVEGEKVIGVVFTFFSALGTNGQGYGRFETDDYYSSNEINRRAIFRSNDSRMFNGIRPSDFNGQIPFDFLMTKANDYHGLGEYPDEDWTRDFGWDNTEYLYQTGVAVGKKGLMKLRRFLDKNTTKKFPK